MAAMPPASVTLAAIADRSLQVVALACEHSCFCNGHLHPCCMLFVHGRGHPKALLTAPVAEPHPGGLQFGTLGPASSSLSSSVPVLLVPPSQQLTQVAVHALQQGK